MCSFSAYLLKPGGVLYDKCWYLVQSLLKSLSMAIIAVNSLRPSDAYMRQ